jgi:type I restriction enzyme R subunit
VLFDETIDNKDAHRSLEKEDGLKEMLEDYNETFDQHFDIGGYAKFKKDVAARLAHKKPYERVRPELQLNLVIVVNQLLTGFDSKWINTLYLDKLLTYQNLIQAFSRTNRLFDIHEKPFGSIRYYRMPHTMEQNIENAVKLYSGDRPVGLFADHLPENIRHMNNAFCDIVTIFKNAGIPDMDRLPEEPEEKAKFAKLFHDFSTYFQAAQIQGFTWDKRVYVRSEESGHLEDSVNSEDEVEVIPTKEQYEILLQRYKELRKGPGGDGLEDEVTFTIDPYLTELNTGVIDNDYMNSRFEKWKKQLSQPDITPEELEHTLEELHKSFAFLSQEDQKFANLFLHDVQTGDVKLENGVTFRDYIERYKNKARQDEVHRLHEYLGVSEQIVTDLLDADVTNDNLNEFGRFDTLKASVVKEKAQSYFERIDGKKLPMFRVNNRVNEFLKEFLLAGGKEIPDPDNAEKRRI